MKFCLEFFGRASSCLSTFFFFCLHCLKRLTLSFDKRRSTKFGGRPELIPPKRNRWHGGATLLRFTRDTYSFFTESFCEKSREPIIRLPT